MSFIFCYAVKLMFIKSFLYTLINIATGRL